MTEHGFLVVMLVVAIVVLGIGQRTKFDWLEIKWPQPSGRVERFTDLPIDRYIRIVEGEGTAVVNR